MGRYKGRHSVVTGMMNRLKNRKPARIIEFILVLPRLYY
jgi:hypothetical protein